MYATAERHVIEGEAKAAYERWVQAELTGDSCLTSLRVLYNDMRDYSYVRPETWDYFELQEMTEGAENLDTQHITELEGTYDPETDEIVAAVAGGERVTYDSFTKSGLERAHERAAQNPGFAFQIPRDQIYHDNWHGPVKEMWRSETDYDTVMYVSTFPEDVIDELGERGRLLLQELAYDVKGKKGFAYGYRKHPKTKKMEGFAVRLGNATPEFFSAYLQKRGKSATELEGLDSHNYGKMVILTNTGDTPIREVAKTEAAIFDQAAEELTGQRHTYGRLEEGVDAYELFKRVPKLWRAYRQYHLLLVEHFNGVPLHSDLYDYLVTLHETTGFHVLKDHERTRLGHQLDNNKITADMALACKKLMGYAHHVTLSKKLNDYRRTGVFADIEGEDILLSYGGEVSSEGAAAAERGDVVNGCETTYGEQTATAEQLAFSLGIGFEEALRRLSGRMEVWSTGECRNCERETMVWKEADGGCNVCRKCAQEHTLWGEKGLERERRRAQAEKEANERLTALRPEIEVYMAEPDEDTSPAGTTRYVAGRQQMLTRQVTVGGAKHVWIDTATGEVVDGD